jgi:hypothetical protein
MANFDFLFSYHFGSKGFAFSGKPSRLESTRIDRMKNQLEIFSNKHSLDDSSYIEVDFDDNDIPDIKYFNIPLGLHEDIEKIIINSSTV